jgi:translation initiation factor 2 beta subunit (eIF-2beta)/eIF-5
MTEEEKIKREIEFKNIYNNIFNKRMNTIREKRNELLAKSDYYFNVPDIKINEEKKAQILKYREELRDFPNKLVRSKGGIFAKSIDEILESLPKL